MFMLIMHNHPWFSGSAATPPAAATLPAVAPRRAGEGGGYSKDRFFTSGVSNPRHQGIFDEQQGLVTVTHCAFTILGKKKKKGRRKEKEALSSKPVNGGRMSGGAETFVPQP